MGRNGKSVGRLLGWAAAGAVTFYAGKKIYDHLNRNKGLTHLFNAAAQEVDQKIGWQNLPTPLSLLTVVGLRHVLREKNLQDTGSEAAAGEPAPPPDNYVTERTPDGTYNDLQHPMMGSANTRFGRNVPLGYTYPVPENDILTPSPRLVSLDLMTRHTFQPAKSLNLLAAAWLQFMIRDWLSHGTSPKENPWQIPLPPGDRWYENPMRYCGRARTRAASLKRRICRLRTPIPSRIGGTLRRSMAAIWSSNSRCEPA